MYVISLLILCLPIGQSTDIDYYSKNYQGSEDGLDLEIQSEARPQLSSTIESIVGESNWKAPSEALSLSNTTMDLETQSEAHPLLTSTVESIEAHPQLNSTMESIVGESNWKAPSEALSLPNTTMDLETQSEAHPLLTSTVESIVGELNWTAPFEALSLPNTTVNHPNHSNTGNG